MIELKVFRENPEIIKKSEKARGNNPSKVDEVVKLDWKWRKLQTQVQKLQHNRNEVNKEIAALKKSGESAKEKIKEMKEVSSKISKKEEQIKKLKKDMNLVRMEIDNILDKEVPKGKDEEDNKELKKVGKMKKFSFPVKSHYDLINDLDVVDIERAAKVTGARFYYLRNEFVLLNMALQRFAMDLLVKKGFTPVQPPFMLNRKALGGAVSLIDFEETIYKIEDEDLYLIGTSEHALVSLHMNELLKLKNPLKYAGISPCFRKEAGSHGKDTKGIFRVHQFDKIEQIIYCKPEESEKILQELLKNSEEILKALEVPYHIVLLCSGDTGGSMSKTYDLEVWFPEQGRYRELCSVSTAGSYQSVKLNVRFEDKDGNRRYLHTLNGTAVATERMLSALIENHQQKDGSVKIPKALWPYMNGIKEIKVVKKK